MRSPPEAEANRLLAEEAAAVDERRWEDWLALYLEDCVYWAPCWCADEELCADPATQLSHVYYASRAGLEDRVWRIGSRKSPASAPMPRTLHTVANVRATFAEAGRILVKSNWTNHVFSLRNRETEVFFGRYEHGLLCVDGVWRIASKKIVLLNDQIPTYLDVYHL
jgi:3-phenylpropionate/cinnamic acid dioxygenase small subunit